MDPFHERVARVALTGCGRYGFCLAGGYAVQAHGFVERRSEDVDLFTTMASERDFPKAVDSVVAALHADGLEAEISRRSASFARISVMSPDGHSVRAELGIDWRAHAPARLTIGPVLHADDAVANKVCALYGRGELRDYIDVDGIVRSARYALSDLLALAHEHDPGFDDAVFAEALAAVERFPDSAFETYGLSEAEASALRGRIRALARQVEAAVRGA